MRHMLFFVIGLVLSTAHVAKAELMVFGPTPYRSAADSPFAEYLGGPNFYLEDFEDGELNTPGIGQSGLPAIIVGPGANSESVDADDGQLDWDGRNGSSLTQPLIKVLATSPQTNVWQIELAFDRSQLGFLPNSFGFVWTAGAADSHLTLYVFDDRGSRIPLVFDETLGTGASSGSQDDRFLGVVSEVPFERVLISSTSFGGTQNNLHVDHVQFGLLRVPEPDSLLICVWFASAGLMFPFRLNCKITRRNRCPEKLSSNG